MPDYSLEILDGETSFAHFVTEGSNVVEMVIPPGSVVAEVYVTPPDTKYQIGGTNPTLNPNILVWFDTQGAQ